MINIVLTILVIPFLPIWFFGDLANFGKTGNFFGEKKVVISDKRRVLGESREKLETRGSENFQTCNLFPVDTGNAEYVPTRKEGYRDLLIWAGSSVAIDVDSGTILHYQNGRKKTQIASLTKMMTAILVLENIKDLEEEVTITQEALLVPGTVVGCPRSGFCTSNRLYRGEKIKAEDLLKAMLLNSANDAATALAVHISGSGEKFTQDMNEKAKSLGLKDTNFCTPSGLEIDGQEDQCFSTAYDIARIAATSLKYDLIWDIMRIPEGEFYSTDGKYLHVLKNTDILLGNVDNCLGGKTGFTPLAGKSLLLGATDPTRKHRVIAVLLNDEKRWEDMSTLMHWIFENYEWR